MKIWIRVDGLLALAVDMARNITVKELVKKYGNKRSDKVFFIEDDKSYLLNCYLEDMLG